MGLILALLALAIYLSFRIFRISDITVDGSFTLGAAVSAILLKEGFHPLLKWFAEHGICPGDWVPASAGINPTLATLLAFLAGMVAGTVTGILHTKFKLDAFLSAILVMTGLYSVN